MESICEQQFSVLSMKPPDAVGRSPGVSRQLWGCSTEMAETSALEAAAIAHAPVTLLWTQACASQLHGHLNAGFGGPGVLRNPGYWGGVKKALSHAF
jgi:hypothetical protein